MDVERLREHLASEYGIVVSNDDPIFAAVALNELVLEEHLSRTEASLRTLLAEMEKADEARITRHKELAKQILGDALRAAKQKIVQATPCPPAEDHHAPCQPWKAATVVASLAAVVGWGLALILVVG